MVAREAGMLSSPKPSDRMFVDAPCPGSSAPRARVADQPDGPQSHLEPALFGKSKLDLC